MKVAVLAESATDEAVCRQLVEAILGRPIDLISIRVRDRGWAAILSSLKRHVLHLEYQTEAVGFAVLIDSDYTPSHDVSHLASPDPECRYCEAGKIASAAQASLSRSPRVKLAIGLAEPCIEAWLLAAETDVSEVQWRQLLRGNMDQAQSFRDTLKTRCYGSQRVRQELALQLAAAMAADLSTLARHFPVGFGSFKEQVRGWLV